MGFILSPIINIIINGGILYLLTYIVDGIVYTGGVKFFILGGIVLGLLNWIVKPLLKIIALPFTFLTGGLFLIVINVVILWFLSYFLDVADFQGVTLAFFNWTDYVIGAIVLGVINWTSSFITK
ncbi:MAG: phage holin family protein [Nitrospirota bacterium]